MKTSITIGAGLLTLTLGIIAIMQYRKIKELKGLLDK